MTDRPFGSRASSPKSPENRREELAIELAKLEAQASEFDEKQGAGAAAKVAHVIRWVIGGMDEQIGTRDQAEQLESPGAGLHNRADGSRDEH